MFWDFKILAAGAFGIAVLLLIAIVVIAVLYRLGRWD